jgi:hypothetical protein
MLQWNIGTGSLQPLLREFDRRLPNRVNAIFWQDAPTLRGILGRPEAGPVGLGDQP